MPASCFDASGCQKCLRRENGCATTQWLCIIWSAHIPTCKDRICFRKVKKCHAGKKNPSYQLLSSTPLDSLSTSSAMLVRRERLIAQCVRSLCSWIWHKRELKNVFIIIILWKHFFLSRIKSAYWGGKKNNLRGIKNGMAHTLSPW